MEIEQVYVYIYLALLVFDVQFHWSYIGAYIKIEKKINEKKKRE